MEWIHKLWDVHCGINALHSFTPYTREIIGSLEPSSIPIWPHWVHHTVLNGTYLLSWKQCFHMPHLCDENVPIIRYSSRFGGSLASMSYPKIQASPASSLAVPTSPSTLWCVGAAHCIHAGVYHLIMVSWWWWVGGFVSMCVTCGGSWSSLILVPTVKWQTLWVGCVECGIILWSVSFTSLWLWPSFQPFLPFLAPSQVEHSGRWGLIQNVGELLYTDRIRWHGIKTKIIHKKLLNH